MMNATQKEMITRGQQFGLKADAHAARGEYSTARIYYAKAENYLRDGGDDFAADHAAEMRARASS